MKKFAIRSCMFGLLILLPLWSVIRCVSRIEYDEFTEKHDLWEDVLFASGATNTQPVKLIYEGDGVFGAYLPSECRGTPTLYLQNTASVEIGGTVYKTGTRLPRYTQGEPYSFRVNGRFGDGWREAGSIRFFYADTLPTLYVTTSSGTMDAINADPAHQYKENGCYVLHTADGVLEASGDCTVRGRGDSSWSCTEKKPYALEMKQATSLLGMGRQKRWNLIANFYEGTSLRNQVALDTAKRLGMAFTPECASVNVYFNGEYGGLYLLTQHIDVGSGTVKIRDLSKVNKEYNAHVKDSEAVLTEEDGVLRQYFQLPNEPEDLSGGYLLTVSVSGSELNSWFRTPRNRVVVSSPEYASKGEMDYISEYVRTVEDSIFRGEEDALEKWFALDSWVKMYLMQEFFTCWDAEEKSQNLYKEAGSDTLYAGPVWDYDFAMGQIWMAHADICTQTDWLAAKQNRSWLYCLKSRYPAFAEAVQQTYRDEFLPIVLDQIENRLPMWQEELRGSLELEYARHPATRREHYSGTPEEETQYLITWLTERSEFFSRYLGAEEDFVKVTFRGKNAYYTYCVEKGSPIELLPPESEGMTPWKDQSGNEYGIGDYPTADIDLFPS